MILEDIVLAYNQILRSYALITVTISIQKDILVLGNTILINLPLI